MPPDVKTISRASAPIRAATRSWASSSAARARRPKPWAELGLPNSPVRNGQHRVEDLAAERRRRGVVEVDRHGRRLYAGARAGRPAERRAPAGRRDTPPMRTFTIEPRGPFDLATARDFAGGFPAGIGSRAAADGAILMTFPVEGWGASAAVQVRQ